MLVLLIGVGLVVQSCSSIPGPKATPEQIHALARSTLAAREASPTTPAVAELSYLHAGDINAPRVIYIHGTPGSADGWADFLVAPFTNTESIAVDRLGFGQSGPKDGSGEPSFSAQAEAIAPLLIQRNGRWPILVGHSLGGPIAARLAAAYPDRVSGLIIVAGSLDPAQEKPDLAQRIATTGLVRFFLPRTLDNTMGELDAAKRETALLKPMLDRITCPVIIIHGENDELVPYENVAYVKSMLIRSQRVETVTLEKQGHFVPWQRPEAIREAIDRLLRSSAPPPNAD